MIRNWKILFAGALLGIATTGLIQYCAANNDNDVYKELSLFGDVFERVRAQYVTVPDDKKLLENAIKGMVTSLDPHSDYLNKEEAEELNNSTKGQFAGIGVEITMSDGVLKIVSPIDDSPAAKAGMRAGDLIIKINGEEVKGQSQYQAVSKIRGQAGSELVLTIKRPDVKEPFDVTLKRALVSAKVIEYRLESDIGYLRAINFSEHTVKDLRAAIKDIQSKIPADKLKGYVLDLRNNPGGLLDQSVGVVDLFLDGGEVVSTRGRDKKNALRFSAKLGDSTGGKPLIVLINGGSASASEIVAGALQDQHRATIVGTRSFGKGSVQSVIPLGDNGALRLTTALYYTPAGVSIQGTGIHPDIVVKQPLPQEYADYDTKRGESDLRGHIKGAREDHQGSGSSDYVPRDEKEDVQLKMAYALLHGEAKNPAFPAHAPQPLTGKVVKK
ncbi:S41 family peptidase [Bartonella sp. DGB2]|uniref:S41 family peptidase n=1 Tax=Bartonella sp. DGB2 TaxID=3388426 RepID=UPI0039901C91